MKFNTADKEEKKQAMSYFMRLINKKALIEVKKINPRRTLNQNSYLHVIIGAFGAHFGYTMEEAKTVYKDINASIYVYKKNGRIFYRSSADIDKEEMAKSIDRFIQKSAEAGLQLPRAEDTAWIRELENEIERMNHFM